MKYQEQFWKTKSILLINQLQIIISVLFVVSYQLFIKYIYGNYINPIFDQLISTVTVCVILLNLLQIPCLNINQRNLQDNKLSQLKLLKNTVQPKFIKAVNENNEIYSLNLLLKTTCLTDIIYCASTNPEQQLKDFVELMKCKVQMSILRIVQKENLIELYNNIDNRIMIFYQNLISKNDEKDVKEWVKLLKESTLKQIAYLNHDDVINSQQIKILDGLTNFKELYNQIKSINQKQICNEVEKLEDYDLDYYQRENQFNISYFGKVCKSLKNDGKQNDKINQFIAESQFTKISGKNISLSYETNDNQLSFNTNDIWKQIEKILGVEYDKTNFQNSTLMIETHAKIHMDDNQIVKFQSRIVQDKQMQNIFDKIMRKSENMDPNDVECFSTLVKDSKRLSLIFKRDQDLKQFIQIVKVKFGNNQENEITIPNTNIRIKINSIKNKFNVSKHYPQNYCSISEKNQSRSMKSSLESNQMDLKIIFEIIWGDDNIGCLLEVQCNIESLIRWKCADHVFYEFERGYELYKTNLETQNEQIQMESNLRYIVSILSQVFKFLTILIFINILFVITPILISKDYFHIQCYNGDQKCFDYCLNQEYNPFDCDQQIKLKFHMHTESNIRLICNKFSNNLIQNIEVIKLCNDFYKFQDNIRFVRGISGNNCLVFFKKVQCINSDEVKFKTLDTGQNLLFGMKDQVQIENDLIKKYSIEKIFMKELLLEHINEKVIDVQISQNRICILNNELRLSCSSIVEYQRNNTFSIGLDQKCFITKNRSMNCSRFDYDLQHKNDVSLVTIGKTQICFQQEQKVSQCWGQNVFGESNIPFNFVQNTIYITSEDYNTCIIKADHEMTCIGLSNDINEMPDSQRINVRQVSIASSHACIIDLMDNMQCYGSNLQGKTDVVGDASENVYQIGTGTHVSCSLNKNKLRCWGRISEINEFIKSLDIDQFNIRIVQICVKKTNIEETECQNIMDNQNKIFSIQNKVQELNMGQTEFCIIIQNTQIDCQNQSDNSQKTHYPNLVNLESLSLNNQKPVIYTDRSVWNDISSFQLGIKGDFCFTTDFSKVLDNDKTKSINFQMNLQEEEFSQMKCVFDKKQSDHYISLVENQQCMTQTRMCQIKYKRNFIEQKDEQSVVCLRQEFEQMQENEILHHTDYLKVIQLSCGDTRVCALFEDHTVKCMGGRDMSLNMFDGQTDIIRVKAGFNYVCLVNMSREIICNGMNGQDQIDEKQNEFIPL